VIAARGRAPAASRNNSLHKEKEVNVTAYKPSFAFIAASWSALIVGFLAFIIGLWNSSMQLNERGYYFAVLMYGLFSAISVQKAVRDRQEHVPVTGIYYGLSWASLLIAITLMVIGLYNATLTLSEKGFYGMAFAMALFASIAVQKNTRDSAAAQGI
jgi:uncharacterized membrane protein YiaA